MSSLYLEQLRNEKKRQEEERRRQNEEALEALRFERRVMERERGDRNLGSELAEMTANYPGSLARYAGTVVEGIAGVVNDPVGAAKGALALGEAALEKGGRKFEEFYTGEEIPADRPEVEAPLDEIADYYRGKYGSIERARQSFVEDPVGSTADVFPFLGQRFGPAAAARTGLGAASGAVGDRLYRHAAGIPKSIEDSRELARRAQREGVAVSEGGLTGARAMRARVGEHIETLIARQLQGPNDLVDKSVLNKHMDELIQSRRGTSTADFDVPFLQKEKVRLMNIYGKRQEIRLDELQKYKTDTYKKAYESDVAGPQPENPEVAVRTEAQRATARAAKEELETRVPGYTDANTQFETYARIIPFIKQRIDSIPDDFLGQMYRRTLDNPNFQSRLAMGLRRAAEGDWGWIEKNFNSPEIRTIMYLVGQHQEEVPEAIPVWGGKQ